MTTSIVKLFIPDPCMFSNTEIYVLQRLRQGICMHMIAAELGLAEAVVKEYVKAIMRKIGMESPRNLRGASILGGSLRRDQTINWLLAVK